MEAKSKEDPSIYEVITVSKFNLSESIEKYLNNIHNFLIYYSILIYSIKCLFFLLFNSYC